tara:strand:+ start:182 stop:412 length:231 start_codon:yes stop_codon:yes gene_type:complete
MNKEFERYLIIFLLLILIGMSGCAKKHVEMDHPKQPTTLETIGKLDAIANVLGCMFDPTPCQKKSEEENVKPESQE